MDDPLFNLIKEHLSKAGTAAKGAAGDAAQRLLCIQEGHKFQLHAKDNTPTHVGCKNCTKTWEIKKGFPL